MDPQAKKKSYEGATRQIEAAWKLTTDVTARLATVAAYLFQRSPDIHWSGFFFLRSGELTVGPYNGLPATVVLQKHQGVCWSCVDSKAPVIVPNTHKFPGHIRRAGPSNAEITVPIFDSEGEVVGVLHNDSADFDFFDAVDVKYLTRIADSVGQIL